MIAPGTETKEIPGVHGDMELLDLFPPSTSRGCGPKARKVTKVVKSRWVDVAERKLLKLKKRCSFNGYAQTYECIVDSISTVPLGWVLPRTGNGEMSKVGHLRKGFDECWHVGCSMKDGRVLLCEEITQFWRSVLWSLGDGCTRCMRCVQEVDLSTRQWI
jgi:hypothetical protein